MDVRDLLESDALRSFGVFAQHRNFTAAAAALGISQPALHVKVRKLAAGLGTELYEREGRSLVLTPAGERLAAFALDSRARAGELLTALGGDSSALAIAAGRGAIRWVIPDAIRAASRQGRRVRVVTASREDAVADPGAGHTNVAVVAFDPPPRRLRSRAIAAYPQVLMLDSGHPLAGHAQAGGGQVNVADLAGLDLVVPPAGRPHRRALERALLEAGIPWQPAAEADGWDLLVHLAALGLGATVVNGCVPAPDGMTAIPVRGLPPVRYWAAWRAQREDAVAGFAAHFAGAEAAS
jgi:LysR family transcriptional regulator, low CO2-responsive transcriptional regulator